VPFDVLGKLREKRRHRPVVVVAIANLVGVELQPIIVEVEDRGVGEIAIGLRRNCFYPP